MEPPPPAQINLPPRHFYNGPAAWLGNFRCRLAFARAVGKSQPQSTRLLSVQYKTLLLGLEYVSLEYSYPNDTEVVSNKTNEMLDEAQNDSEDLLNVLM